MTEDEARLRLILAMCPARVCRTCGEPSRRISEAVYFDDRTGEPREGRPWVSGRDVGKGNWEGGLGATSMKSPPGDRNVLKRGTNTLGWTDCGHDDWRPGVVLDPFA